MKKESVPNIWFLLTIVLAICLVASLLLDAEAQRASYIRGMKAGVDYMWNLTGPYIKQIAIENCKNGDNGSCETLQNGKWPKW